MNKKQITLLILCTLLLFGFTYTYDTATPAGSDDPAEADDRMREIKAAIQERLTVEHYFELTGTEVSDSNTGRHKDVTCDSIKTKAPRFDVTHPDYGADGSDASDDSTAIQAAIDDANTAGGGVIYFPQGDYYIGTSLDAEPMRYISFEGDGMFNSRLLASADIDIISGGITWTGSSSAGWAFIRDLGFGTTTDDNTKARGIKWQSANPSLEISNCRFDFINKGIFLQSCWGIRIKGLFLNQIGHTGIELNTSPNGASIENVYVQGSGAHGITSQTGNGDSYVNCIIEDCDRTGISLAGCRATTIENCYFEDNIGQDIVMSAHSGVPCQSVTIENCFFNSGNTYVGSPDGSGYPIWVIDAEWTRISNCIVNTPNASHHALVNGVRDGEGMLIENCGQNGMGDQWLPLVTTHDTVTIWGFNKTETGIMLGQQLTFNAVTFTNTDATPTVAGGNLFRTYTNTLTITDFDDGIDLQEITVISKAAITFDTTSTNLTGSSVDIVTAAGDTTKWICDGGTTWRLIAFVDASEDNSGGA